MENLNLKYNYKYSCKSSAMLRGSKLHLIFSYVYNIFWIIRNFKTSLDKFTYTEINECGFFFIKMTIIWKNIKIILEKIDYLIFFLV